MSETALRDMQRSLRPGSLPNCTETVLLKTMPRAVPSREDATDLQRQTVDRPAQKRLGAIWAFAFRRTSVDVRHAIRGVLACRLAQAGRSVLVIEAGEPATLPAISVPPDWPQLQGSSADWRYVTVPQRHLDGRIIPYPRGKVVGGSSAINALAYQRGHRAAFDRWPEGWRSADLLPYFRRAENFSGGSNQWRGGDGPLHVLSLADVKDRNPLASVFIEAAESLGFPMTKDIGGENPTGVGWNQLSIKGHVRDDAATAYLGDLANVKVDLLVGTEVQKLRIENGRCTGVQLVNRIVRPEIETLLCAGAIDSPRILMLSGIGPADHIRSLGLASPWIYQMSATISKTTCFWQA